MKKMPKKTQENVYRRDAGSAEKVCFFAAPPRKPLLFPLRPLRLCGAIILFLLLCPPPVAAIRIYAATALTGGAEGALDAIDKDPTVGQIQPVDGDILIAIVPGEKLALFYFLDGDSGLAESSPSVIKPDDEAGDKRWILSSYFVLKNPGAIRTGKTAADVIMWQAYDTDGATYSTFVTLTAGTSPSMIFDAISEIDLEAIDDYKADGTRIDRVINNQGLSIEGSGDLSFGPNDGDVLKVYPDGSGINFNPSGTFDAWSQITVINAAATARTINFDSNGLNQPITQNQRGIFVYDGANWLKIYVGS